MQRAFPLGVIVVGLGLALVLPLSLGTGNSPTATTHSAVQSFGSGWTGYAPGGTPVARLKLGVGPLGKAVVMFGFFKSQTGRVACQWTRSDQPFLFSSVQCGVATGFRPPLPGHSQCKYPSKTGQRVVLVFNGRPQLTACATDSGPFADLANATVLGYGKTWKADDIACTETAVGLTCRNHSGHGFLLSQRHWRTF